ncbi:SURF1 family protein [Aurantiacibacter poecillastricola]|uniref:SURF1 family protein n=1 Tax=Aurantiacibacter poecillastricola TaxID=3064385 RepID=UPI00273F160A|nr:SURF1 family cytochrome oxidase biogenesis protein [Aurantiacibacter sp. 219JJ12-13]MDP5261481.1 SURF1 family cytochrome oxidase biogenesis protein [Aurantiacibacter sp. 219JJ12-13]
MRRGRIPVLPTVTVVIAAAIMVALGFWQLGRLEEKEALIARYEAALESGEPQPFPADAGGVFDEADLFHPTALECTDVLNREAIAGRAANGAAGFAQIVRCETPRGTAEVKLGWSDRPDFPAYEGGAVRGLITPGGADGARVQADPPLAGLEPLARPDPAELPNNHLAYAGQWFFFAITALVIYALAVRRRWREVDRAARKR